MRKKQNLDDLSNVRFRDREDEVDQDQEPGDDESYAIPRSLMLVNQLIYVTDEDDMRRSALLQLRQSIMEDEATFHEARETIEEFQEAIDKQQTNPEFQFYSLTINGVEDVSVEKKLIRITLRITSEQFKDNDESTIIKKQDIWTFQKTINSKLPIWFLAST